MTVTGDGCAIQNDGTVTVPVTEDGTQCTCTNTRTAVGSITVVLGLEDGSLRSKQRFGFQGDLEAFSLPSGRRYKQRFADLQSGRYTIAQASQPNKAWSLASISCDGGHEISDNNAVRVKLASGEDVTCTFTARFDAVDEAMAEETRRFIYRRVDNLLSDGPDRSRLLRRVETPAQRSSQDGALKFAGSEPVGPGPASVGTAGRLGSVPNSETTLFAARGAGHTLSPYSAGGMIGSVMMSPGPALNDDSAPSAHDATRQFPLHTDDLMRQGALGMRTTGPASTSTALFSLLAGQVAPLGLGQSSSFTFGTSLSEMRAKAVEAEALGYQKKMEDAGLSLSEVSGLSPLQAPRAGFDLWVEGQFSGYTDDIGGIPREGDFWVVHVGADYVLAPGVLVGALVQADDTKEDINGSERTGKIEGAGWMEGPYFGIKLLDNLFFDTCAAWGRSDNDIWLRDEGLGFRNGIFETDRWLATATLTGVYTYGNAWRLSPELGWAYGYEAYDTYTNSLDQMVPGASAKIGRLTGGAELADSIQMGRGTTVEPMVGIAGIWNFDSDALVIGGVQHETDESRAKVEGGLLINTPSGWSLRAAGNYDGLGGGDFQSYGGSLWINVPWN